MTQANPVQDKTYVFFTQEGGAFVMMIFIFLLISWLCFLFDIPEEINLRNVTKLKYLEHSGAFSWIV